MISMIHRAHRRRLLSAVVAAATLSVSLVAPAEAAPPLVQSAITTDLSAGAVGPLVTELQEALIAGGVYLPGGADGVFGAATTKAIADFQQWNGLIRTGTLNIATLNRLGLSSNSGGTPAAAAFASSSGSSYSDLKLGSTGSAVTEMQRALLDTGLVISGGADGIFGPATQRALIAFQSVNGLTQNGEMSERAAQLMGLGTSSSTSSTTTTSPSTSSSSGWAQLERFPAQGHCAYGDTWHAPRGNGRVHEGVDIIAATGKLLYAVTDGTISTQYWDYPGRLSGNGLKLTAADGTYFLYLHMSGFAPGISKGTKVKAGDVIGFVGNTGSSATPHLHFEIHPWGGSAINPYPYVRAIDDCSNTTPQYQASFA